MDRIKDIGIFEWSLFAAIFFTVFWILNPYIAKLLTLVLPSIFMSILVISLIADRLDPSKIGPKYYLTLLSLIAVPLLIYIIFGITLNM
jgi:hypothetical protein